MSTPFPLDNCIGAAIIDPGRIIMPGSHSTREAAARLGLTHITLKRYIASGKIPVPAVTRLGGVSVRLWSDRDIERVRAVLPKIKNGRKIRHSKQRNKQAKRKSNP